jgi:hypothetical protein
MDKKSIDVRPIYGLCISLPQHPFAAEISACSDAYRLVDFQIVQCGSPWLQALREVESVP